MADEEVKTELKKLTKEEAIAMLDKSYSLTYVDRDDHLSDEQAAEIVATGYSDGCLEGDWMADQQWESVKYIMNELFAEFDIDDIEDEVREAIYDRDDSTVMKDLIRNTRDPVMYYDLEVEIDGCGSMGADIVVEAKKVAKALKLNYKNHEQVLKELVANASYGGKLVLLFGGDLNFFYLGSGELPKYIVIEDPLVCIMDRWNGSGHSVSGLGSFKVRVDRTRFQLDEAAPGYSFAKEVCGMTVDESRFIPSNTIKGVIGPKLEREPSEKEKAEIRYEKKWNETKVCSFLDMKMSRHKDTPYINSYPCGNKCSACGTFWID